MANPVAGSDASGFFTFQVGWGGTTAYGVLGGLIGSGVAFDTGGNIAFYGYGGGGPGVGLNEGAGLSFQFSNAQTVNDLSGQFANSSVSGGIILGGTLDQFSGDSDNGPVIGFGFTLGEDTGASLVVGRTYTWLTPSVSPYNFFANRLFSKKKKHYAKKCPPMAPQG